MIDTGNQKQVENAFKTVDELVQDWYGCTEYQNAWNRYLKRVNAYYRRHESTAPKFRSKLYFASFYIACQAMEAQFKAAHASDPFIFVKPALNSRVDPTAKEKAALAHSDLNYDLKISRFKSKMFDLFFYVNIFGTAVGREYIRTKQEAKSTKKRNVDAYNIDQGAVEQEDVDRVEYTATDIIHPLNFGHDRTKKGFVESEWATTRFELSFIEIYKMLDNPNYYQPGIKKLIEKIDKGEYGGYEVSQDSFYSEKGGSNDFKEKNLIVANEYSGPINFNGNRFDDTIYYMLYSRDIMMPLKLSQTPFLQHPYWKISTCPCPDGPYGMSANDQILPINEWENYTINQYNDWMTTALKFMFEVQPDNIVGGMLSLINGLPNGLIALDKDVQMGQTIKNVGLNQYSLPPVRDMLELISKAKQEYGSSSNLRGKDQGSNADTATGISLLAQREDTIITSILDNVDLGLMDGMQIKLQNTTQFFSAPRIAEVTEGAKKRYINHYPYELRGIDWAFDVKRITGNEEVGKHMSFLKLLTGIDQALQAKGSSIPAEQLIDLIVQIGTNMNISNLDRLKADMMAAKPMPPQISGAPGAKPPNLEVGVENAMATA